MPASVEVRTMRSDEVSTLERLRQEPIPITSLTEIANRLGVSRQRIHQLVRKHDIPTYYINKRESSKCAWCGELGHARYCVRCFSWSSRSIVQCDECHAYFARYTRWHLYPSRANDPRYTGANYCCRPCSRQAALRRMLKARGITWAGTTRDFCTHFLTHEWVSVMKCKLCGKTEAFPK